MASSNLDGWHPPGAQGEVFKHRARLGEGERAGAPAPHLFDGLVCLVGCDKTIPAAVMALARLDLPGRVFYNGSIAAGR